MHVLSHFNHVQLVCNPTDYSPPGSSVQGMLQARILNWVFHALLPGDLHDPGIENTSLTPLAWAGRFFTTSATWEAQNNAWEMSIRAFGKSRNSTFLFYLKNEGFGPMF